jgi:enoyl-CoA hydratase
MKQSTVTYTAEDRIGTITLNRPEKMNAFNAQMLEDFAFALDVAQRDDSVRVVIVRGAGRAFSVGYDISPGEFSPHEHTITEDREWLERAIALWLRVWDFPKPVIAQVTGIALQGRRCWRSVATSPWSQRMQVSGGLRCPSAEG